MEYIETMAGTTVEAACGASWAEIQTMLANGAEGVSEAIRLIQAARCFEAVNDRDELKRITDMMAALLKKHGRASR